MMTGITEFPIQSVFGGLGGKKKKKKKRNNKGKQFSKITTNSAIRNDAQQFLPPDQGADCSDAPHGEIQFVLPRSSSKESSGKLIPFLFPSQQQILSANELASFDKTNLPRQIDPISAEVPSKKESIDDILFPEKKNQLKKSKKSITKELLPNKRKFSESNENSLDNRLQPRSIGPEEPPKSKEKLEISFQKEIITGLASLTSEDAAEPKSNPLMKKLKKEQKHTIDKLSTESDDNIEARQHCGKVSGRSVEDAINDEDGRRPRANSTDGELDLPQRGLCDERIVLESHVWNMEYLSGSHGAESHIVASPRGFVNLGNSCFLNATLQCLIYMPSFCQCITALPSSCYETDGSRKKLHGQHITMILRSLLRTAHGIAASEKNNRPKSRPIAPKAIFNAITSCKINGHRFRPGRQEDAHELLVHLLDAMHEGELIAAGIDPHASGWRDKLPIPRLDETTFVHRIFGGYFRSQLRCNKCGYKSNTYDPFLDLALEVSKHHINSLASAFQEFTRKETLDSNNRWKCSGCNRLVCPTKHLSVFRPPLSLCIQLKRFVFGSRSISKGGWGYGHRDSKGLSMMGNRGSKITKKIDFPAELKLPLSDGRFCEYFLTGVIVHVGNTATSGHYTAYVKQPGKSSCWYQMDDSFVDAVSEKAVLKQRDAYVLFYSRREVKLEFPRPPPKIRNPRNGSTSSNPSSASHTPINSRKIKPNVAKQSHRLCETPIVKDESSKKKQCTDKLLPQHPDSGIGELPPKRKVKLEVSPDHPNKSFLSTKSGCDEEKDRSATPTSVPPTTKYVNGASSGKENFESSSSPLISKVSEAISKTEDTRPTIHVSNKAETSFEDSRGKIGHEAGFVDSNRAREIKMRGNNVEVVISRVKKKRVWNPLEAAKLNSRDGNDLLGNIAVGNWDQSNEKLMSNSSNISHDKIKDRSSLRALATEALESDNRSRKRKMYLDRWDAAIDEGKRKKVKIKTDRNDQLSKASNDAFQRLQRNVQLMNKGNVKGFRQKGKPERRILSQKRRK